MVLSVTSTTFLLLSTRLRNVSKNVKKRKSVKSTILLLACQPETIPYYTSAYDMDMRKVIDVYAAATEHVDQDFHSLSSCVVTFQKVFTNGRRKISKRHVTCLSFVTMPLTRESSLSTTSVPLQMMVEVGANQCESCVI